MGKAAVLEAREYKLLLDRTKFSGKPSANFINAFWDDKLKTIIKRTLDARDDDRPRHVGQFAPPECRTIVFRDTREHLLDRHGYALRERRSEDGAGQRREITLKLRTPDLLFTGAAWIGAARRGVEMKFEEDVAPLQVTASDAAKTRVLVAWPRSTRSQFALSITRPLALGAPLQTLGDSFALYRGLQQGLEKTQLRDRKQIVPGQRLCPGPEIREFVFKGAAVDLGDRVDGRFTFTLWYFNSVGRLPDIAEISFKCKTQDPAISARASWRARALFIAMQDELRGWVNLRESSKTALALPPKSAKA